MQRLFSNQNFSDPILFQAHNESKNIFKAANTPITLGAVAMLLYVLCQLFSLVGLLALANIINLVLNSVTQQ